MVIKGFKYIIGYKYCDKIKPMCTKLPKMSRYTKCLDKTKHINFLIKDGKFLEVYNKIWKRV